MKTVVSCIKDKKDIHCIINPYNCIQQAQTIQQSSLIRCKFCKAYQSLTSSLITKNTTQCHICKSLITIPSMPDLMHETKKQSQSQQIIKIVKQSKKNNDLQVLVVVDTSLGVQYSDGLLCLADILPDITELGVKIGCILYNYCVRIVELQGNGRVIKVNPHTYEMINQQFYSINNQSMEAFKSCLLKTQAKKCMVNGSRLISEIVNLLTKKTIIIWVGQFDEDIKYYPQQRKQYVETIAFLKIPRSVSSMNLSKSLLEIKNNVNKTFLIPVSSISTSIKKQLAINDQITEMIHYQLYNIFMNQLAVDMKVQVRREDKYPPQILTKKNMLLGSLHDNIVIRLALKNNEQPEQLIQISFTYFDQGGKQIIVAVSFQANQHVTQNIEDARFLSMFKILLHYRKTHHLGSYQIRNIFQRDIMHCFNQYSMVQMLEIQDNMYRYEAIYMIWPWIGFKDQKPVFYYYFKGYYCCISEQQISESLEYMREEFHTFYAKRNRILPLYYNNIAEMIKSEMQYSQHYKDTDSECSQTLGKQFYKFVISSQ